MVTVFLTGSTGRGGGVGAATVVVAAATGGGAGGGVLPLKNSTAPTMATTAPPAMNSFVRLGFSASASSISEDADDSVLVVARAEEIVCAIVLCAFDRRRTPVIAGAVTLTSPTTALRKSSMLWNRAAGSLASDFMIAAARWGGALGTKSVTSGGSSSMCFANSSPTPSALNGGRPDSISNR